MRAAVFRRRIVTRFSPQVITTNYISPAAYIDNYISPPIIVINRISSPSMESYLETCPLRVPSQFMCFPGKLLGTLHQSKEKCPARVPGQKLKSQFTCSHNDPIVKVSKC